MKWLWLLLLPILAFATEQPNLSPSLGASWGDTKTLFIGTSNLFDQEKYVMGVKRYGSGVSRLQVGNTVGLSFASSSGFFLNNEDTKWLIHPRVGVDFGGRLVLNTNSSTETYYEWLPMISIGPQFNIADCNLYFAGKYGVGIGNLGIYGILPRFDWGAHGAGIHLSCEKNIGISYSGTILNENQNIESIDLIYKSFTIRGERSKGFLEERSLLFLVRL